MFLKSLRLSQQANKKQSGFTLVELMVVLVIVGILAAIALPSYQDSIRKSRRSDAQGTLQQFRQAMERYYTRRYTYVGATVGAAGVFGNKSPIDGAAIFYTLSIVASNATTFTIQAVPQGPQVSDTCGTLTLTNTGVRGSVVANGGVCWN